MISLLLVLIGLGIAFVFYRFLSNTTQGSYRALTGKNPVDIDKEVIQQYLNKFWEKQFPEYEIPNWFEIKNNQIHLHADLPYLPREEQKSYLQKIEKELGLLFEKMLGYNDEFFISATFESEIRSEA